MHYGPVLFALPEQISACETETEAVGLAYLPLNGRPRFSPHGEVCYQPFSELQNISCNSLDV